MPVKNIKLAELINGRAAMFGCSALGLTALAIKINVFESALSQDFQSLWWALGIYASS